MTSTLLQGAVMTAWIAGMGILLSLPLAFLVGMSLLARSRAVRALGRVYVEFWRGSSIIVQLFWAYFVPPLFGIYIGPVETGIAVLSMNVAGYGAEIVRGAVQAVPRGQWEATVALNMPVSSSMRRIILPQALPQMVPPFGNLAVDALKATALFSLIAVPELSGKASIMIFSGRNMLEVYGQVLVLYFLLAVPLTVGSFAFERLLRGRMGHRRRATR